MFGIPHATGRSARTALSKLRQYEQFVLGQDPIGWYSADARYNNQLAGGGGDVATEDGATIGLAFDRGRYGNHLSASGATRPVLKLNIQNGMPAFRFDGVDDLLTNNSPVGFNAETGFSIFCVASRSVAVAFAMMVVTKSGENELRWDGAGTTPQVIATASAGATSWSSTSTGWHIYHADFDDPTDTVGISLDNAALLTQNAAGALASNCISVAARPAGTFFFNGDMTEIIIVKRSLLFKTDVRGTINAYLKFKYATP